MSDLTLSYEDICDHTPRCEISDWLECTVSDYRTYHRAYHWLRVIRNQKVVFAHAVKDENGNYTGEYRFKFLCKNEFLLFVLKWK